METLNNNNNNIIIEEIKLPEWVCPHCGYEIDEFDPQYKNEWPNSSSDHLRELKHEHLRFNCDILFKEEYLDVIESWKTGNKKDRILLPKERRFFAMKIGDKFWIDRAIPVDWLKIYSLKINQVIGCASYGHDKKYLLDNGDIVINYNLLQYDISYIKPEFKVIY